MCLKDQQKLETKCCWPKFSAKSIWCPRAQATDFWAGFATGKAAEYCETHSQVHLTVQKSDIIISHHVLCTRNFPLTMPFVRGSQLLWEGNSNTPLREKCMFSNETFGKRDAKMVRGGATSVLPTLSTTLRTTLPTLRTTLRPLRSPYRPCGPPCRPRGPRCGVGSGKEVGKEEGFTSFDVQCGQFGLLVDCC